MEERKLRTETFPEAEELLTEQTVQQTSPRGDCSEREQI